MLVVGVGRGEESEKSEMPAIGADQSGKLEICGLGWYDGVGYDSADRAKSNQVRCKSNELLGGCGGGGWEGCKIGTSDHLPPRPYAVIKWITW